MREATADLFLDRTVASGAHQKLIFTDLDGTLLDHHSYSHAEAESALQRLAERGVPCLINSSKTAAEILPLHRQLGLDSPVIVENGSANGIPPSCHHWPTDGLSQDPETGWHWASLGRDRWEILPILEDLQRISGARFRGFSELGLKQIEAHTGLPPDAAARANRRNYSEPLLWEDSTETLLHFTALAAERGLHAVRGGRFVQIIGAGADKGRALKWCANAYSSAYPATTIHCIALGDAPNDGAMLAAADIAVWVRSPVHTPGPEQGRLQTLHTTANGPAGWAEAIHQLLDQDEATHG